MCTVNPLSEHNILPYLEIELDVMNGLVPCNLRSSSGAHVLGFSDLLRTNDYMFTAFTLVF